MYFALVYVPWEGFSVNAYETLKEAKESLEYSKSMSDDTYIIEGTLIEGKLEDLKG